MAFLGTNDPWVKAFVKGKNRIDKVCLQCRNDGDSISILVS